MRSKTEKVRSLKASIEDFSLGKTLSTLMILNILLRNSVVLFADMNTFHNIDYIVFIRTGNEVHNKSYPILHTAYI